MWQARERGLARVPGERRQDALHHACADLAGERGDAQGSVALRHEGRLRGIGDAVQPGRAGRRAVRDVAQAARLRARRHDGARAVELRPYRRKVHRSAHPLSWRRGARRALLLQLPLPSLLARREDGATVAGLGERQRVGGPARGAGAPPAGTLGEREHAGRRLQGHADRRDVGPRSVALGAGRHPRLRREDRRDTLELSHHPASRRVRLRHVAGGGVEGGRRHECLVGGHGRLGARDGLLRDRFGVVRLLRGESRGRQPVRQLDRGARRQHGKACLALPGAQARPVGPRLSRRADAGHRQPQRDGRSMRSRRSPRPGMSGCSIARPARSSFRASGGACRRRSSTAT